MSYTGPDPGSMTQEEMYSHWPPGTTRVLIGPDRECADAECFNWWTFVGSNPEDRAKMYGRLYYVPVPFWNAQWYDTAEADALFAWCATVRGWTVENRTEFAPHPLRVLATR